MKIIRFIAVLCCLTSFMKAQEYSIFGKIDGLADGDVLLGYYYGDKQYVKDTVQSQFGFFHFQSDEKLEEGMYFILLPNKQNFQLIIDKHPNFSFETNVKDLIGSMKIKGSKENELFYQYQKFTQQKNKEAAPINKEFSASKKGSKKHKRLNKQLEDIGNEVLKFKYKFMRENPSVFFVKLLKAMEPVHIPKAKKKENGEIDENFQYNYYKSHYWDHYDLLDERIIRTPIFHEKMVSYLKEYTPQIPDSINASIDTLIHKVKGNETLFKYIINWTTHHYESSKIMGQDAVFVHLVFTYFITGQTPWIEEVQLSKIINKAMRISPNLIGAKAPYLQMPDNEGMEQDLYKINAPFTVIFFYDPDCGHCKEEAPKVRDVVKKYADKGVKVYAVCTEFDAEIWKEFIVEQEIENWVNVIDLDNKSNFRGKYNVLGTPRLFVLDEKKKIIAKQIDSKALGEILENEFKLLEEKKYE